MRCKNCGWPNKPNETVCVKCGSPLEAEASIPEQGNSYEPYSSMPSPDRDGLKKTVMESDAFQGNPVLYGPAPVEVTPTVNESACPKCGYPLRADAVKCPNCNTPVNGNSDSNSLNINTNGYQRRPTRMSDSNQSSTPNPTRIVSGGGGKLRRTILPDYIMNISQDPSFILTPLQRMNERKAVEPVELDLEDGEVVLTRDNTEPGNPSITSKAQAVVSHADGHWYIENRSEQNTTFVMARNKIELHSGDIILLGNRMFEFKEQ